MQIPAGLSDDYNFTNPVAHSLPRQNDENTKLAQILTDFAEQIIDISHVEHVETLEQQEINEKMAYYTQKLNLHGGQIAAKHNASLPVLDNLTMKQITEQIQSAEIR